MVPHIAVPGTSFKGAFAYYGHDKQADTSERVAFIETLNLRTDDPEQGWKIMAWTAEHEEDIKRCAKVKFNGEKVAHPVYAFSLSWSPDESPDQGHQIKEGKNALEVLGLSEHQAIIIGHNDTDHPHVHVLVNLIHPTTGKAANLYKDRLKLSEWAEQYEREQGKIRCQKRVQNNRKRENGEFIKYQDPVIQRAWDRSDNGKSFAHALKQDAHILARGDSVGFVIVDPHGKVINPTRKIEGAKAKDIRAKLADLDPKALPSVEEARKIQSGREAQEKQKGESDRRGQKKYAVLKWSQAKQDRYNQIKQARIRAKKRQAQIAKKERADFTPDELGQQKRNQLHLKQLDEKRALEHWADKRREKAEQVIRENYRTDQVQASLKAAEAQLKAKQSLFYRMTGKTEQLEHQVEALKRNLENIRMRRAEYTDTIENQIKQREEQLQVRHNREEMELVRKLEKNRSADPDRQAARDRQTEEKVRERIRQREERERMKEQTKDRGLGRGR